MRRDEVRFFGASTTLLLATALIFTGVTLLLSALGRNLGSSDTTRTAVVGEPGAILSIGQGAVNGYTDRLIATNRQRVQANPADAGALAQLGIAYLQKARETNDPGYYGQAEKALQQALAFDEQHLDALSGMGSLSLSLHDFVAAEDWGRKAVAANPDRAYAYGIVGDAQIELGKYDAGVQTIQRMVDLKPDLASYSRVSYVRELHGDLPGAIEAMRRAVSAGSLAAENTAWCRVQLGNLYFTGGALAQAEKEYSDALRGYPNYLHALAGLAQVRWAQGRVSEAIELYQKSAATVPLPQYVAALGDLYSLSGDQDRAREQYELVAYIFQVWEAGGVDVGLEKALFLADHDPARAQEAVQLAERAAASRGDVNTLDTYAWALYNARELEKAESVMGRALRLGTANPLFYFHIGMIQKSLGKDEQARTNLKKAVSMNPHFSILHAKTAQDELSRLGR